MQKGLIWFHQGACVNAFVPSFLYKGGVEKMGREKEWLWRRQLEIVLGTPADGKPGLMASQRQDYTESILTSWSTKSLKSKFTS